MEKTRTERNRQLHQEIKKKNEEKEMQLKNLSYKNNKEILSSVDSSFFDNSEKEKNKQPISPNNTKKNLIILFCVGVVVLILIIILILI